MPDSAFASTATTGPRASGICYLGAVRARRKFELFYPDGFRDETYLIAERAQKEQAHQQWRAALGAPAMQRLLARGEFRQIADAALRIEARTNLLFSFERMALREALRSAASARLFVCQLHAFLHGRGPARRRFEDWVSVLAELPAPRGRVLSWPVATVFGFLARPDRHLLLKPQATRRAARAYGFDLAYQARPCWPVYANLQTFAAILRRDLDRRASLRARDMIDLQGFIAVQGGEAYEL